MRQPFLRSLYFAAVAANSVGPAWADEVYRPKELFLRGGTVILQPTQEQLATSPSQAPPVARKEAPQGDPSKPDASNSVPQVRRFGVPAPSAEAHPQVRVINQPLPGNRVIVSMERRVSEDDRKALLIKGIEIGDFLGDANYVAKVTHANTEDAVRDSTGINKIIRIFALDTTSAHVKIAPELSGIGTASNRAVTVPAGERIDITVQLFPDVNVDQLRSQLAGIGEVVRVSPYTRRVELKVSTQGAIERIARIPGVMAVAPTYAPKAQNTRVRASMGVPIAAAAPYNLTGQGVKVGIWDGGHVAEHHPSFQGRLTVDLQRDGELRRDNEHATHVAGTIAGSGEYVDSPLIASGGASSRPFEREVTPFGNKVANPAPQGGGPLTAVATPSGGTRELEVRYPGVAPGASLASFSFRNAVDELAGVLIEKPDSIDVVNNSWSVNLATSGCGQRAAYDALGASFYDALINGDIGGQAVRRIPVLFAAGNFRDDGLCEMTTSSGFENYRSVVPPGTAKNVITVGAIDADNGTMTSFSGWGPTASGRLKPDVVAAGCRDLGNGDRGVISAVPRNGIGRMCGTSMATPAVTGGVALLMEHMTARGVDRKSVWPSTWKALLIHGAADVGRPGPDFEFGYGRVDLPTTLKLIDERAYEERTVVKEGDVVARSLTVPAGRQQLKVTLAWDDPASSALANDVLVNDLDLVLVSPSGARLLPLVVNAAPGREREPAAPGVDRLNVVEQVVVNNPDAGDWRIETTASLLGTPRSGQTFSLVISMR